MANMQRIHHALCVLVLSVLCVHVMGDYSPKDAVVILTEKNFEKEVLNSPDYWIVEFYAPWCGHCKSLEPEFKAAAKKLKKHARLGAVDATVHAALAQKYKIKGYPTLKEFGANKKKPRDYQGGRTSKDIVQYVKNSDDAKKLGVSGITVETLDFKTIDTFLKQDETTPTAIIFGSAKKTSRSKPPSWVSSLAQAFVKKEPSVKGRSQKKKPATKTVSTVRVVFVAGKEEKIAAHFQIEDQLPAVVVIDATNSKFVASSTGSIVDEKSAKKFITSAIEADAKARESKWTSLPNFPAPEIAKKIPRVQLNQLSPKDILNCIGKKGKMCVIISAKSASEAQIKELAKRYRRDPFRFFVADHESGSKLFDTVAAFVESPKASVLVVKPGKIVKFTSYEGDATESGLHGFLDKIIGGSMQFQVPSRAIGELEAELTGEPTPVAGDHQEL